MNMLTRRYNQWMANREVGKAMVLDKCNDCNYPTDIILSDDTLGFLDISYMQSKGSISWQIV